MDSNYSGLTKGRDDSAAVLVGGNFIVEKGAEVEGKIVVLGDFAIKSGSGFRSLVKVGFGSQVIPNSGEDTILIGGDFVVGETFVFFMNDDYGNIVYRGIHSGNSPVLGLGSNMLQNTALDMTEWSNAFSKLQEKGSFWGGLTANGVISIGSWKITLTAGDDNPVQVFHMDQSDLQMNYLFELHFHSSLAGKTILINVKADSEGKAEVFNVADFVDTSGSSGSKFSSDLVSNILWNFYDAKSVKLGGGNGEFRGSVLVPQPDSEVECSLQGHSGRMIVNGNLILNKVAGELHNYNFDPPTKLPCPSLSPTSALTFEPTKRPT